MSIKFNGAQISLSIANYQPTDFSKVTARPEFVLKGKTFHDETGQLKTGTAALSLTGVDTSDATATEGDVMEGATFYAGGEKKTGAMPERSESDFSIGYSNGDTGELKIGYAASKKTYFNATEGALIDTIYDQNFIAGNIKKDTSIFGVVGTYEGEGGGSAEFNIAYGDTEPTDTSKLWVKTSEPSAVKVTSKIVTTEEQLESGIGELPTGAHNIASAVVGTKVYLFGGYDGSNRLNTINVFDTETNTITTLSTTLPAEAYCIASAVVGTKVYLFGGYTGRSSNSIRVFDTETNTITTLSATLPTSAYGIASAVVGTKVYLFGGYYSSSSSSRRSEINVFDTATNGITTLSTTLPTAAYFIASAVVGTKVYLFGGISGSGTTSQNTINVFDTETNTITTLSTTLPTAAYGIASAVVGTKVYLFGGACVSYFSRINVFDTETNTITTLSTILPTNTTGIASAVVGTKVYLFGGSSGPGTILYLNTINVFVCALALAANNMLIETSIAENLFTLLSNVEIGVKNVYLGNADGYGEKVAAALHKNGSWVDI